MEGNEVSERDIATVKDVRVFIRDFDHRPSEIVMYDAYNRHSLTLSPDEAETLSKALAAGAATLRDQPKGKR